MSKTTFDQTNISQNYSVNMANKRNMDSQAAYTPFVYEIFAASITTILALKKKKDTPTAVVIRDLKGNFKFAGMVSYDEAGSDDMPGNWNYSFTFDESDLGDATQINITDPDAMIVIRNEASTRHGLIFCDANFIFDTFEEAVDTLVEYLNVNANPDEVLEVEFPGYFVASVAVEDGSKVLGMVPSANMKQLIKDDKIV